MKCSDNLKHNKSPRMNNISVKLIKLHKQQADWINALIIIMNMLMNLAIKCAAII